MSAQKGSNSNGNLSPSSVPEPNSHLNPRRGARVVHVHRAQQRVQPLNKDYEVAFPALAPSDPSAKASAPILAAPITTLIFFDSFVIENVDLLRAGKNGTPKTLSEIMDHIMLQNRNVKLEASTQRKDGRARASFVIKAETEHDLEDAKRKISAALNTITTRVIQAPVSAIGIIIGRKGANIDQLCAKYNVRLDIPRKGEDITEEGDEPTQPASVIGFLRSINGAIAELNTTIAARSLKITRRVRDIPNNVCPFIAARFSKYYALAEAEGSYISLSLCALSHGVVISGDRPGVVEIIESIEADVQELGESLSSITMSLDKPQHRLLAGSFEEGLIESFKCVVVLPTESDAREITLWGLQDDLLLGLAAVAKQANSEYTESLLVPVPSAPISDYLLRTDYFGKVMVSAHPGVRAYIVPRGKGHTVDLIGEKQAVAAAIEALEKLFQTFLHIKDYTPSDDLRIDTPTSTYPRDPKYYYDDGNILFLVGGVLFKLSKSILLSHMDQDPLSSARTTRSDIERSGKGTRDNDPFVISGATTQQFRWFLLLLLGTPADPEYRSRFTSPKNARSPTKDDFLCHLGIYAITQYFGMSELHVWSYYQLKGILELATGFFNTSWDKDTIMQAVTCVYEENHWFFYNLHAFIFLTLSTSALNNPLVHESLLLSNLDTCVALYKDPSLPETHPILFGYAFTVILSLGLRSSVWTEQLTRDDRNILYAAQAHLASLGDDYFLEFSWISQSPAKNRSEYCSDSCTKYANTAWSASFASYAVLDSTVSLMDASKLALLPSYRHLFAECTRPVFKSCRCKCARKALRRIDEGIEDIFYAMCRMHEYLIKNA